MEQFKFGVQQPHPIAQALRQAPAQMGGGPLGRGRVFAQSAPTSGSGTQSGGGSDVNWGELMQNGKKLWDGASSLFGSNAPTTSVGDLDASVFGNGGGYGNAPTSIPNIFGGGGESSSGGLGDLLGGGGASSGAGAGLDSFGGGGWWGPIMAGFRGVGKAVGEDEDGVLSKIGGSDGMMGMSLWGDLGTAIAKPFKSLF